MSVMRRDADFLPARIADASFRLSTRSENSALSMTTTSSLKLAKWLFRPRSTNLFSTSSKSTAGKFPHPPEWRTKSPERRRACHDRQARIAFCECRHRRAPCPPPRITPPCVLEQPIFIIREQRMERFGEHRSFDKFHQSMVRQWRTKGYGFWLKATVNRG
jgi:hypothetical protein